MGAPGDHAQRLADTPNLNHGQDTRANRTTLLGENGVETGKLDCFVRVLARRVSRDEAH